MRISDYFAIYMNGMTFMFFIYASFRMFTLQHRSRAQTILSCTLAIWAFNQFKELIFYFPAAQNKAFIDLLLLVDGWAVPACSFYLLELTAPGWLNRQRMIALWTPYLLFTITYYIIPDSLVLNIYWAFVSLYAIGVVITITFTTKRFNKYVKKNYSYSKNIDVNWLKKATILLVSCLVIWMCTSIYSSGWGYCIYYLSSILLWAFIIHYSEHQISIPVPDNLKHNLLIPELTDDNSVNDEKMPLYYPFKRMLQKVMEEDRLYLNPKLAIADVSNAIGTNRTYLSNYFNNELNITFYDYINKYRIEKSAKELLALYPWNLSIEEIAERSGFNSISTFRRAFLKQTGMTPQQFRKAAQR